jgi:hypothetical protein
MRGMLPATIPHSIKRELEISDYKGEDGWAALLEQPSHPPS